MIAFFVSWRQLVATWVPGAEPGGAANRPRMFRPDERHSCSHARFNIAHYAIRRGLILVGWPC